MKIKLTKEEQKKQMVTYIKQRITKSTSCGGEDVWYDVVDPQKLSEFLAEMG